MIKGIPMADPTNKAEPAPQKPKRKKSKLLRFLRLLFIIFVVVPLAAELVFFLMHISPGAVIPDTFFVYAKAPNPRTLGPKILEHESLPELLTNPLLAPLTPILNNLRTGGVLEKAPIKFALRGSVSAALINTGSGTQYIAAWDSGFLAPFLRFLPFIARFYKIPNLLYVQSGISRFEYRSEKSVVYIGYKKNLLIASGSEDLFLEALSPEGAHYASEKKITLKKQDISLLLSSGSVMEMMEDGNPLLADVFTHLKFPDHIELGITIEPKQLNINLVTPVSTRNEAFSALISENSIPPSFMNVIPESAQYYTSISSMGLREVLNAVSQLPETKLKETLETADKMAKSLLRLTVDDLLYSWTADEFAVFGLEDRPTPVFAIKIGDEAKRKAVFDKAFQSVFLKEDTRLVLDGNRIPQIEIPGFVNAILKIIHVTIPRPYYIVHEGWIFISEAPENLLSAVTELRQNKLLAKKPSWQKLSGNESAISLSVFYSLNRSLPFFLKGGSAAAQVLRMYRNGLMKLSVKDNVLTMTLSAEPGSAKGLESMPGYPINIGRKTGNAIYAVLNTAGSESRLLLTRDTTAIAVNPMDHTMYELEGDDPLWVIPAEGLAIKTMKESPAAWVVSSRGLVTLVNGYMETMPPFPVITGLKLSAAPAAWNGLVYLFSEEGERGTIYTVDSNGHTAKLQTEFSSPVLSPPVFISGGSKGDFMSLYPKSFLGEIFLCDVNGTIKEPFPVLIPGIAYGSPLLFYNDSGTSSNLNIAFITMAGELYIYNEEGIPLPGFPLELNDIFYVQPVWDGSYLWIVSEEGMLYRVNPLEESSNRIMEQKIPNLLAKENGFITEADVDGDGIPEIFISGEGNALYGYTRNMISIDGFPLSAWGKPAIGDLDGDNITDLAALGMDNKLYRWRFRTGKEP